MSSSINSFTNVNACKKSKRKVRNEDTQESWSISESEKETTTTIGCWEESQEKKRLRPRTIYNRWLIKRLKKFEGFQEQTHKEKPSPEERIKL